MRRVCFYHAGCPDGFGAAWAAWTAWGDAASYLPITHDEKIAAEDYTGDFVAFVDIFPENQCLRALGEAASELLVLDHHITSLDRYQSDLALVNAIEAGGHEIHFDLSHSGAVLSWQYFHPQTAPPDLLLYVEDQDLWNWKLPRSREVNAAIASYARSFDSWQELAERSAEELATEGEPIVRANRAEVARALHHAHPISLLGRRLEAVNASYERANIGHDLAKRASFGVPWGCVYRVRGSTVYATLYSIGDMDVSELAARLGGGGHRNAAGFSVSLDRWISEFL